VAIRPIRAILKGDERNVCIFFFYFNDNFILISFIVSFIVNIILLLFPAMSRNDRSLPTSKYLIPYCMFVFMFVLLLLFSIHLSACTARLAYFIYALNTCLNSK